MPDPSITAERRPDAADDTQVAPVQPASGKGRLQAALWRDQAWAEQLEQLGGVGRWELDLGSGELTWSPGTYRIFGVDPRTRVTHATITAFYSAAARHELQEAVGAAIAAGRRFDFTLPHVDAGGAERWVQTIGEPQTAPDGRRLLIGVVRDVTEARASEARLRHMAAHDPLTGLANRSSFLDRLDHALTKAAAPPCGTPALVVVDIDGFDEINDRLGHAVGDAVLIEVARRLGDGLGPTELLGRLGGDEFALLLQEVGFATDLRRRLQHLLGRILAPGAIAGTTLPIGASIGSSLYPEGGAAGVDLLRSASLALRRAKRLSGERLCIYDAALGESIRAHGRLLAEVRAGLAVGAFTPYYQPIVDLRSRVVRGWEALIRWVHPIRGVLAPAAFLPALEDPELSAQIGRFVLQRSLQQMRTWLDAGAPVTSVNVNVAESQLGRGDELIEAIVTLLERHNLTPDRLKLEILESAFLGRDPQALAATLGRLQRLGVVVALDDFGTGYASLSHIKQFDIGRIKIDQSFVRGLGQDASSAAITRAIIEMGRNLGIRVTAEGIERPEQLALLRTWGCDCGQGYLFARPMSADAVPGFLRDWASMGERVIPEAA